MNVGLSCKSCGGALASSEAAEFCPGCLLGLGLFDIDEVEPEEAPAEKTQPFGDYELIEQVGRGGMGVVYKARQRSLNRLVALKMLLHADAATPEELERLRIEAETAASLRHPNIVPVFEFGDRHGRNFIVMDFIAGRSLANGIAAKAYEWPDLREHKAKDRARELEIRIARLARDVALAVQHAHQCGVVHRDIKPSNILLDGEGKPYLTDFGIAKALDGATSFSESGIVRGTLSYMSPEQADGKPTGFPADVFSLGAVLYELLTGQPPFRANTFAETLCRLKETDAVPPRLLCRWVHGDLSTICLKCIEKEAAGRYASAGDLASDLDRWLAHQPIKARQMGPAARTQRWVRRNPVGTALIATLVGALIIFGVLLEQALSSARQATAALKVMMSVSGANIARFDQSREARLATISEVLGFYGAGTEQEQEFAFAWADMPKAERHVVGVTLFQDPLHTVQTYAAILLEAEKLLLSTLHRPVAFDLVVFKDPADLMSELAAGRLDIARITTREFVEMQRGDGRLQPLAQSIETDDTVILFAQGGSDITGLAGLKGHEILLFSAHYDETAVVKEALAAAGLTAADVSLRFLFDELRRVNPQIPFCEFPELPTANIRETVFRTVIDARRYVAGVSSDEYPTHARKDAGWVPLAKFEVPRRVWVSGPRLKQEVAQGIQRALLESVDPALDLGWPKASRLHPAGFAAVEAASMRRWEIIHQSASRFDMGVSVEPEEGRDR